MVKTVNQLYKLSGTEQLFTDWINDMKYNYAQSGSNALFEDWLDKNYMNFEGEESFVNDQMLSDNKEVAETVADEQKNIVPVVKKENSKTGIFLIIGVLAAFCLLAFYNNKTIVKKA